VNLADHSLESERYVVGSRTLQRIWRKRVSKQGRVIAVGTTVTRTLETLAMAGIWDGASNVGGDSLGISRRRFRSVSGRADLFITPGYRFRAIDGLITNFHLPRSSLLALVAALAGIEPVLHAYRVAVKEGYRFYSYGDAMLIL
jgi:S-adenosylmethionine:tRNA ribosyltransferase-isomerase